mmetsp:Transcript_22779/g.10969  ORF Transcript_22779/g.10969 Transcript_22779/m.10969 type:complete len:205 (+) Transcript_22779:1463-2077(+)
MNKKKKVGLLIGHSLESQGARSSDNEIVTFAWDVYPLTEYYFNVKLVTALMTHWLLTAPSIFDLSVYTRSEKAGVAYKDLPNWMNSIRPPLDFLIEFHCNAFDTTVRGTEALYYHRSAKSKKIAELFQKAIPSTLGTKDRGVSGITEKERGGWLLKKTRMSAVILEPFFIDNSDDYLCVLRNFEELTTSLLTTIQSVVTNWDFI